MRITKSEAVAKVKAAIKSLGHGGRHPYVLLKGGAYQRWVLHIPKQGYLERYEIDRETLDALRVIGVPVFTNKSQIGEVSK